MCLIRRVGEHKHGQIDGYSRERQTDLLVWYEHHRYVDQAILREKRIKRWLRPWKFALVEQSNPHWSDLYPTLLAGGGNPIPDLRFASSGMTRSDLRRASSGRTSS